MRQPSNTNDMSHTNEESQITQADRSVQQASSEVLPTNQIVEGLLGTMEWLSNTEGYCECPGKGDHHTKSGRRDCKVYLDKIPTIYCVHSSCRQAVEAKSTELRKALAEPGSSHGKGPRRITAQERARIQLFLRKEGIRKRAAASREQVLAGWRWPMAEIITSSPTIVPGLPSSDWRQLLSLFNERDVVWCGDWLDSGRPEHSRHFRTREQWLAGSVVPGQFVCPSTFMPGSFSRGNACIKERRFLVVESDTLAKDEVGAIFRWLREKCKLPLRAVVDAAGKSLHGWFDYPKDDELEDLRLILPQLGCDPKLFTPSQPVRLPGAYRTENCAFQRLLFLDTKEGVR